MSQGPETVLMGGPPDLGIKGWAPAEIATVCVACAASRLKANPELIVLAPSGERRMMVRL